MNPNSIPFSSEVPKEEGAYLVLDENGETNAVKVFAVDDCEFLYFRDEYGERFAVVDDETLQWSPKLIPITALEDAQKRIGELETVIRKIYADFKTTGQSVANYSDGEYTQDYMTRRDLVEKALKL